MLLCLSPLCSADEITLKNGEKVRGEIGAIARSRVSLTSGGVSKVYWLKNIETINIGKPWAGSILTYKIGSAQNADEIILPPPSYDIPELNYEPSTVQSAISNCAIKLSSGETVKYYGVKIPEDALATAYNRALVEGKEVNVHTLENGEAIVICDGKCVNAKLIEDGMALADKETSELQIMALFSALEDYARTLRNGRWGLDKNEGGKFIFNYLSPEEPGIKDVLAYVDRDGSPQAISWKKVPPPPKVLNLGQYNLTNCTVIVGSGGASSGRRTSSRARSSRKASSSSSTKAPTKEQTSKTQKSSKTTSKEKK